MLNKLSLALLGTLALAGAAHADTLLWNFTDLDANVDVSTPAPGSSTFNFTISALTASNAPASAINATSPSTTYTGASGGGNFGVSAKGGTLDTSTSTYIAFTITPTAGYTLQLTDFDFGLRSTTSGPIEFALRSDADNFATNIFTGTATNNSAWVFKDQNFTSFLAGDGSGQAIAFRLYTYGGTASASATSINARVDDLTVTVNTIAVPEPSAVLSLVAGAGFLALGRRRSRLA